MPCIDFTTGPWGQLEENNVICSNTVNNTFTDSITDPATTVSIIIANGKAFITTFNGDHWLFFSTISCGDIELPNATLVIRFTKPQKRVTFQLSFDEHGIAPAIVNFYKSPGDTSQSNLMDSRSIPWNSNQFVDVSYENVCKPIQEVFIRTDRPENSIDNLCWEISDIDSNPFRMILCYWKALIESLKYRIKFIKRPLS